MILLFIYARGNEVLHLYFKHGFPSGFKFKDKLNSIKNVEIFVDDSNQSPQPNVDQDTKLDITTAMYHKLTTLLNKHDDSTSLAPHIINTSSLGLNFFIIHNTTISLGKHWILDTGSIDHIFSSLQLFYSHHNIKPITVKLPTRSQILSNKFGIGELNENPALYNVLFFINFKCNLISTYHLSSSNQCRLLFYNSSCISHALSSLRMIALAKLYHNMYLLNQDSSVFDVYNHNLPMKSCNYNVSTKFSLWHHRLGHPSYNVINKIKQ